MKSSVSYKIITNTSLAFNYILFIICIFSMHSFSKHNPEVPKFLSYIPSLIIIISITFLKGIKKKEPWGIYGYMIFTLIISIISIFTGGALVAYCIINIINSLIIFYMFRAKINKQD